MPLFDQWGLLARCYECQDHRYTMSMQSKTTVPTSIQAIKVFGTIGMTNEIETLFILLENSENSEFIVQF